MCKGIYIQVEAVDRIRVYTRILQLSAVGYSAGVLGPMEIGTTGLKEGLTRGYK